MPSKAEQRRADTQVSRAVRNRVFEVVAHASGNDRRVRVTLADVVRNGFQRRERTIGRRAERCHGHHARECRAQDVRRSTRPATATSAGRAPDRPGRATSSRSTWTRQRNRCSARRTPASPSASTSRCRSTECTRCAYDATEAHLLVCNAPTKCQRGVGSSANRIASALGNVATSCDFAAASWSRFSPTSVMPSSMQQHDVGRREGLGDRDDMHVVSWALRLRASGLHPIHHVAQVARELTLSLCVDCRPRCMASRVDVMAPARRAPPGDRCGGRGGTRKRCRLRACSRQLRGRRALLRRRAGRSTPALMSSAGRPFRATRSGDGHDRRDGSGDVVADFVAPATNGRPDRGAHRVGPLRAHLVNHRARRCPRSTQRDRNAATPSTPAAWIGQHDERAIGRERRQRDVRDGRHESVDGELGRSARRRT